MYQFDGVSPLEIAEKFIDSYIERISVEELVPGGVANYHQGVFLTGVEKIYLQNKKEAYNLYLSEFFDRILEEDKKLKRWPNSFWSSLDSLDFRQVGNLLCRLCCETGDARYLASIAELVETLKTDFPKNSHGGLWHMKSQPNQMWLDGLYMAGPLCAKYSVLSGKKEFGKMAVHQAILMYENMRDPENQLLYHGWDDSFEAEWADPVTGLSAEKWGRALGWFSVAAVEILEALGSDFDKADILINYVRKIFAALIKVQKESGYWCQVIDKPDAPGNWEETSGTCLIAYAMAKAVRIGLIDKSYLSNAKKAYEAVVSSMRTGENGELILDGICVGTCIESGTYEHYINRDTVENDLHGGGAFLLMCSELALVSE